MFLPGCCERVTWLRLLLLLVTTAEAAPAVLRILQATFRCVLQC